MSETEIPQSAPTAHPSPTPATTPAGTNGLTIAGFILALLGLLGSWIPLLNVFSMILGAVGAILAALGLAKAMRTGASKALAITGLALGVLTVIIAIAINVAFFSAADEAIAEATDATVEAPQSAGDEADDRDQEGEGAGSAEDPSGGGAGTTRGNPVPLGTKITDGDWTVTINSVTTTNADSVGQGPAAGSSLLVVNLTATYNGHDDQGQTPWVTVKFVGPDGTSYGTLDGSTLFLEEDPFDSLKTLYHGGSVTGDEMIEVSGDNWQNGVLAVSPGMISDDVFVKVR